MSGLDISELRLYKYDNPNEEPVIVKTLTKDTTRTREDALEAIYRQLRSSDPPDTESAVALLDKLFFQPKRYDLGVVGRFRINDKLGLKIPMETTTLTVEDIVTIIKYLLELHAQKHEPDDIDHLGNRRVRTVGEQLTAQLNLGLNRMVRTIRERIKRPRWRSIYSARIGKR